MTLVSSRPLRALASLAASAFLLTALGSAARAQRPAEAAERGEIILRNLPPRGSKAYNDLLGLAGKEAKGQVLRFSKTEMWSMPVARLQDVIQEGGRMGVKVTRLGERWNHILHAPSAKPAMTPKQEGMMNATKSAPETMSVHMMAAPDPAIVEYALMKNVEGDNIGPPPPKGLPAHIVFPLGDRNLSVKRTSVDMRANGCTWRGVIEETGEPVMVMWWKDGRFSGMFTYRGRQYTLKSMGGEIHAVVETDPGKLPPDHGAMQASKPGADVKDDPLVSRGEAAMLREPSLRNPTGPGPGREDGLNERRDAAEPGPGRRPPPKVTEKRPAIVPLPVAKRRALAARKVVIDLMLLYTPKVESKYIDIDADLVALAIEQTNTSFANSGVGNVKVRLAHAEKIDYDESKGEHFEHLYRMVDGVTSFSKIRALRNAKKADVVILVVDDPSGCGLSTRVAADAADAYAVVHHSCAALSYSIAHELGHILGARHDRSLDSNETPFPYGHGYVNGTKWRDIMSYKQSCDGCPRQPFWSNPTMKFLGDAGGAPDTDNARVILEQAERVARFR